MRCPQCDYRLWNLAARACPECGRPFKPSEFEFRPDTVEFCCPHCGQPHLGRGDKGLLSPPEFDCTRCGRHVHMDDMLLRPASGLDEVQTTIQINPWLDTTPCPLLHRYFTAVWCGIAHPRQAATSVPTKTSIRELRNFVTLNLCLYLFTNALFLVLISQYVSPHYLGHYFNRLTSPAGFILGFVGLAICSKGSFQLTSIWSSITYLLLQLTGSQPQGDRFRTLVALSMTSGVHILAIVPCVGIYLAPLTCLAWVVTACIAVQAVHATPPFRTVIATLTFPVILTATIFGIVVYIWMY